VHLAVNTGWMLAFGGAVAQRTGTALFLVFSIVCGLCGAALFMALHPCLAEPMIGASGAISGLVAATFRFLFSAIDTGGLWRLNREPAAVPLMSIAQAVRDRRVVGMAATWLVINLLAIVGVGNLGGEGAIAWEAHIGGFIAGFLLFGFFDRAEGPAPLRGAARPSEE
jgi:membrane associated rhomboid family serine protease